MKASKTARNWETLFDDPALVAELLSGSLPKYLNQSRWFGAKSSRVKKYELEKHLVYQDEKLLVHFLLVEVIFITSNSDTYFLPVSFRTQADYEPDGLITEMELDGVKGALVDGLYVPAFRDSLFRNIAAGAVMHVRDGKLEMENGRGLQWKPSSELTSRMLKAEQSNTTLIYNDTYFLKIYRKLYRDLNPDFEVSRHLTEKTDFENSPAYCGAITWTKSGFYKVSIGLMQKKVENEGDAWPWFLKKVEGFFNRLESQGLSPDSLAKVPLYKPMSPEALPAPYPELIGVETLKKVQLLAKRTAELHLALFWDKSDLNFSPIAYSEDYKVWQLNRIMYMLDHRITTMEAVMDNLSPRAQEFAEEFLERKVEVKNRILKFDETQLNSDRIRIHGDYHLGQILVSGDDFIILDFEGEPEATIRDRKVKQSPLKDVAGLCRSFHYAVYATIFSDHTYKLSENDLSAAGGRFYRAIVAIFLDTYLHTAFEKGLNVGYAAEIDFLLRYHIFEKAIYELGYELNSRPDWVIIPLKGLNQILNND